MPLKQDGSASERGIEEDENETQPITIEGWRIIEPIVRAEIKELLSRVAADVFRVANEEDTGDGIRDCTAKTVLTRSMRARYPLSREIGPGRFKPVPVEQQIAGLNEDFEGATQALQRAHIVVQCANCKSSVLGAEALAHISTCPGLANSWLYRNSQRSYSWAKLPHSVEIYLTLLTDQLHLTADATPEEVGMSEKLYKCNCGSPEVKSPMSFAELVGHISDETKWYATKMKDPRCACILIFCQGFPTEHRFSIDFGSQILLPISATIPSLTTTIPSSMTTISRAAYLSSRNCPIKRETKLDHGANLRKPLLRISPAYKRRWPRPRTSRNIRIQMTGAPRATEEQEKELS